MQAEFKSHKFKINRKENFIICHERLKLNIEKSSEAGLNYRCTYQQLDFTNH